MVDELVDTRRFTADQVFNDFWHCGLHTGDSARNIASAWLMEEISQSQEQVRVVIRFLELVCHRSFR